MIIKLKAKFWMQIFKASSFSKPETLLQHSLSTLILSPLFVIVWYSAKVIVFIWILWQQKTEKYLNIQLLIKLEVDRNIAQHIEKLGIFWDVDLLVEYFVSYSLFGQFWIISIQTKSLSPSDYVASIDFFLTDLLFKTYQPFVG